MKVNVSVFSNAGGKDLSYSENGDLTVTGEGFAVNYSLDGDPCRIECRGGTVVQTRRGAFCAEIGFAEGEHTECVLEEGGRKFSFPVYTESLSAELHKDGCIITLAYRQNDEDAVTELIFKAERLRERNGGRIPRPRG